MKKKIIAGLISGLFLTCMVGTASATLIQNGTFDTDLSSWNLIGPNTWEPIGTASIGKPGADLDSSISQSFTIAPGTTALDISFDYLWAGNNATNAPDIFTVTLSYLNNSPGGTSVVLLNETNIQGSALGACRVINRPASC